MSIIQGNAHTSAGGGGFNVERSLRFNSADSAYLNRTLSTPTDNKRWTWSCWLKRSGFGGSGQYLIFTFPDGSNYGYILLTSSHTLEVGGQTGGVSFSRITSAVFRDVSAWYAITVIVDTTLATANDRIKIYVNNVLQTLTGTAPSQNSNLVLNTAVAHRIGAHTTSSNYYLDGYLTEVNFIDGQALTPSSFGETDTNTGVWKPKAFSGTYGTNGFYLKFADNSGTTSTTLGKDSSGNGNNWTPNNFSVTAGAGNDSLVDSPTSYGTDTGVGGEVRGNYATWNPLDRLDGSLANGNLDSTTGTVGGSNCRGTFGMSSGKWYFEVTPITNGGIANIGISVYPGTDAKNGTFYTYQADTGNKETNSGSASFGSTYTTNDVIGVAYDADAGKVWFAKNGTWQASGNPASGTNEAYSGISTPAFSYLSDRNVGSTCTAVLNAGQRAFAYTAPSGFKALCTQNLPTPTIGATSTTQAGDYFNTVLYTGTGSSQSITGVGFQPDFIWIKDRSNARAHVLQNAIAGFSQYLQSNATDAETTASSGVTAVGSDGFTVGTQLAWNSNTETFVAWNWNAGGSNATNTSGTITSTVRANTTSGFSIVTYTGNGSSGATIGHGLGAVPSFYIVKNRGSINKDWECYHISLGNTKRIRLNQTAAADTGGTMWANTTPTSTVFSVGVDADVNASTNTYVAYCFAPVAGYSAFGSYTGNAAADGPFIYTGFRPRFVIRKCSSATSNWFINDAARNPSNVVLLRLNADLSDAESSGANSDIDFLSNGFKIRATSTAGVNQSGQTHIYMAFAEVPMKYSLGR